jgi:hypothetical protein
MASASSVGAIAVCVGARALLRELVQARLASAAAARAPRQASSTKPKTSSGALVSAATRCARRAIHELRRRQPRERLEAVARDLDQDPRAPLGIHSTRSR